MKEWFVKINGDEFRGPYSSNQMRSLATAGRLSPHRLVRLGLHGEWIAAGRIQGLFPVAPPGPQINVSVRTRHQASSTTRPPAEPRTKTCPFCSEEVRATAIKCRFCNESLASDNGLAVRRPLPAIPAPPTTSQTVSVVVQQAPPPRSFYPYNPAWNPAVAAFLSFLMPGLGQMYKGQIVGGMLWFLFVLIGYMALVVPGLLLHCCCVAAAAMSDPAQQGIF